MNRKYLFVAEADKIQDLLFRSSRLREVAGGSQMLTEFCKMLTTELTEKFGGKVFISAGGSFRILFDSKDKVEKFGEYLSELYRRELGGTITIAEPIEVTSEKDAVVQSQRNLRKAKHSGKLPISVEQIPYMAICTSCGIGIARSYKKIQKDEKEKYICEMCDKKSDARNRIKEKFLSEFYSCVIADTGMDYDFPRSADTIAELEPRNYVAYVVADVNNMGVIFSSCDTFDKLGKLSDGLNQVIQQSLAIPARTLMQKQPTDRKIIPVLPLILGGDDVFTLIPASWAMDFTLRFCQEFEKRMKKTLEDIDVTTKRSPAISASIIICKGKFPYLVAHEIGENLLLVAKKFSKKKNMSHISFTVITGSEIVKAPQEERKFVAGSPAYSIDELKKLVEYRYELKDLSGSRRAQLDNLFRKAEELRNGTAFQRMESEWLPELKRILNRLRRTEKEKVWSALRELGDPGEEHHWLRIGDSYYHKLPDLLGAWDFAYDLEKDLSEYEEVDR